MTNVCYPYTLHADKDFTAIERCAFDEAVKKWAYFTQERIDFNIVFDAHKSDIDAQLNFHRIMKVRSDFYYMRHLEKEYKMRVIGYCQLHPIQPSTVYIVEDRIASYDELRTTIMHELGHWMGLYHIKEKGVMQTYNSTPYFTENDAAEACRIWKWSMEHFDY